MNQNKNIYVKGQPRLCDYCHLPAIDLVYGAVGSNGLPEYDDLGIPDGTEYRELDIEESTTLYFTLIPVCHDHQNEFFETRGMMQYDHSANGVFYMRGTQNEIPVIIDHGQRLHGAKQRR